MTEPLKPHETVRGKVYHLKHDPEWRYLSVPSLGDPNRTSLRRILVSGELDYYLRSHTSDFVLSEDQGHASLRSAAIPYKYDEPRIMADLQRYIDDTYSEHYAQTSFQSTEVIIDSGHGLGFCLGNVLKYANRYGRKEGYNRKDLFKILHYTLIAIFIHDKEHADEISTKS